MMTNTQNRNPNRDRLLSLVQNREVNRSPIPLVYDLTQFGGNSILLTNYYKTDDELREIALKEKQEDEELRERLRSQYPNMPL